MSATEGPVNDLPIRGHYLTELELDGVLNGSADDVVYKIFVHVMEGGQWFKIEIRIRRASVAEGLANVLSDSKLMRDLIASAHATSALIDGGATRSPGLHPQTGEVLAKFRDLSDRERRLARAFLMEVIVSFVVLQHFGVASWGQRDD